VIPPPRLGSLNAEKLGHSIMILNPCHASTLPSDRPLERGEAEHPLLQPAVKLELRRRKDTAFLSHIQPLKDVIGHQDLFPDRANTFGAPPLQIPGYATQLEV
jgi:hypothetical protein